MQVARGLRHVLHQAAQQLENVAGVHRLADHDTDGGHEGQVGVDAIAWDGEIAKGENGKPPVKGQLGEIRRIATG